MSDSVEEPKIKFEERRSFIRSSTTPEIRGLKRILNKITDNDSLKYQGYRDAILEINILSPDNNDVEKDKEDMKPVVLCFMNMIYEDTETNNIIKVYSKLFTEIVNKWKNNQGNVLLSSTIQEIQKFLFEYYLNKEELDESDRRKCFCIVKFLYYLYNQDNNVIPGKIIMIITEKFCSDKENLIEIFLRILEQNFPKLLNEKIFANKLKGKYKTFLATNKDNTFSSKKINYNIEKVLNLFTE